MGRKSSGQVRQQIKNQQRPLQDTSYWTGGGIGCSELVPEPLSKPAET